MNKFLLAVFLLLVSQVVYAQSLDDSFSRRKMKKDLEVFQNIRLQANSGLFKYRTKEQIDSIYHWAENEVEKLTTYLEFYNLICTLTDFEGSLHNGTTLPSKINQSLKAEKAGYFPFPVKMVEDKLILNLETDKIPLGAEILSINKRKTQGLIPELYKYYTTDGINKTGKSVGINRHFSKYYRLQYGLEEQFLITFKSVDNPSEQTVRLKSVGYSDYNESYGKRHSKRFEQADPQSPEEKYAFEWMENKVAKLTLNSFSMGNEKSPEHLKYVAFLDSVFLKIKQAQLEHLIVDVRNNGGGTDPNDLVTYSYLTDREFVENKQAWITFRKIPYIKHLDVSIPKILRPFGVGKYNKLFQKAFPVEKEDNYYQGPSSADHQVRCPDENAFIGKVYLLISPKVASAASLFAAMLAGNENTLTIGEESMGGYYGHNGHTSLTYVLPKSGIKTTFSLVNLKQDVPEKENQFENRGIIPDYTVPQTFDDFMQNEDTQMDFVLDLIKEEQTKSAVNKNP